MRPTKKAQEAAECLSCDRPAQPMLSAPEFAFAHTPEGLAPTNTGVSALDHEADRVIGRDAETQWAAIQARVDRKKQVMAETGAAGKDLSRMPDESYRVMQPEERQAAESARDLHHKAVDRIKKHARGRKYLGANVSR